METRKIGSLDVTVCGLGTNNFGMRIDQERTTAVVDAALEAGITFFDTADLYGGTKSEQFLGKALGARRDDVVIATKFGGPLDDDPEHRGGSARWVRQACEDSLRRLGTDRIDLYQLHFPDMTVPIEETLTALDELVKAGKVREIGNSNFTGEMIEEADDVSEKIGLARFVSAQNMYSLLHREPEDEVIPACQRRGLAFLPYFPLASGLLTGKYKKDAPLPEGARITNYPEDRRKDFMTDRAMEIVERLDEFARARDHTLLDLAMSWLLHKPVVASVIAGATKPEQARANAGAVTWRLTDADLKEIDEITKPR
ncbi:MAG TPA: aldo/keto reductase [Actinomycetota bacterium]|nr:aldo/keto reductase [Actinomycetota bacterium]